MNPARSAGTSGLGAVLALWYAFKNRSLARIGSPVLFVDARSDVGFGDQPR
jgi:hypothetical protein